MTGENRNWGRWGHNDERGALNLLTPEVVIAATRTCSTGRTYQLGIAIQREGMPTVGTRGAPQRFTLINHTDRGLFDSFGASSDLGFSEDIVTFATHAGTHMDALCHVDYAGTFFNGFPKTGMTSFMGAEHCGIENVGAIVSRGVLVDVAAWKGLDVLPTAAISLDDFRATLDAQGTEIRPGDVVVIRTGWLESYMPVGGPLLLDQPGIGFEVARWLAEQDVVAVAADNSSVETMPWDQDEVLGIHVELLVRNGIYLIEHLWLKELAEDKCYEFLFCASPLPVTGATGSPLNPIAIG